MQYRASLIAVLGLSATSFAAPQASIPELASAPSVLSELPSTPVSALPIPRDAQNLASPFSAVEGVVAKVGAKRQIGGLSGITSVADPVVSPVADILADVAIKRNVIQITDVVTSVKSVRTTVVSDVSSIKTLITSVGTTAAGQQGLAEEIIKDLGEIVTALTGAVDGVLAQTLPTVLGVVVNEVTDVLAILSDVEVIVFQIVQVLSDLLGSLLDSTFELVTAEVSEVYSLLNPVLTPILSFVGLVQGDAGVTQEVSTAVGGILTSANGLLSAKGLKEIEL
ncbi:hypothetical protein BCIN_02g07070 [Botrytis cinerea B05.10]|uniref:Uncharacterized protein n=2 Tax=Botryotinia fuckeliana TaxID=40559 RepID=A0A384JAE0_BOTFB|nr:hypothetical protein BCIN_02g07070 [Botrytis cinerea B05.10]ATZ47422.1 hypothetical protein BCIN_02g07070 [Botrytis cinerea B05.10]EMR83649.1 hypothetical protein BcDW1_7734 [Botrytis cinerea BcDW1]